MPAPEEKRDGRKTPCLLNLATSVGRNWILVQFQGALAGPRANAWVRRVPSDETKAHRLAFGPEVEAMVAKNVFV
jgi:hypothetical protein